MIDTINPRMTLDQWSQHAEHQRRLNVILNMEVFEVAMELLLTPQVPAKMAGVTCDDVALTHQFQAGATSVLRGLRKLASMDPAALEQARKLRVLSEQEPWQHAEKTIP